MPRSNRSDDEVWRDLLEGNDPDLTRVQRFLRRFPGAPRCTLCAAPFGRPGSLLFRPLGWRRWAANPTLCTFCARGLDKDRGGAEIEATFLFADIRGSTGLAETLRPAEFHALLERFYRVAAEAIDASGGLVDKYLGDGVVAMFVPVFAHAGGPSASAIRAGQAILASTGHGTPSPPWVPVGIGIHTGPAFIGVMGTEGGQLDFTGVGDSVNIAARLGSAGAAGELLVSTATAASARLDTTGLEGRTLELKGRAEPVDVVVLGSYSGPARDRPPFLDRGGVMNPHGGESAKAGERWVTPVVLEGHIVRLEPLAEDHLDGLADVAFEPAIWRWTLARPTDRAGLRSWLEAAVANATSGTELPFATIDQATGRAIGSTRFMSIVPEHRRLEIGWTWLGRAWQRTGANREAKLLQLSHGFDQLGANRVEFKTDSRNEPSRSALLGIGATFEGIFRNHMVMPDGPLRHSAYYSVISDEWPAVRARLKASLASHG